MKRNNYLSIIIFIILFMTISQSVESQITPEVILSHEANESIVYHWFSYVPANMSKSAQNYILIMGQNGNVSSDDYNELINETRNQAEGRKDWADTYKFIMITPVIPRSPTNYETYTVSLDRESLLDSTGFNQRPDLKVNLMIDEFINLLRSDGYNIHDKVFIEGFSAGAMFAQRYCLLHPERVKAIAAGQCGGSLTVPGSNYNNTDMNWPVGVNDFESLVNYNFNLSNYKQVPQFIYIGDQDTNNSTVAAGNNDLFTDDQMDFLNQNFGDSDPVRLKNQSEYMQGIGCKVEFKLYPNLGHQHQYTSDILNDIFAFFDQYRDRFIISGKSGDTTEDMGTATVIVKLTSQPMADVVIGVSSSDTTEGTVSPTRLTFTMANWNTGQTVTVTGVDDDIADGNQTYTVLISAATSTDSYYDGWDPDDVWVINIDNEPTKAMPWIPLLMLGE